MKTVSIVSCAVVELGKEIVERKGELRVETDLGVKEYCYLYIGDLRVNILRQELLRAIEKSTQT